MIKLQIIGNLGKDCVTNTVNGKNVINFSVAHTEKFRDAQGNQKDKTIWVECAYWTDRTGVAPYLKKGTQVYAEGTPEVRTYPKNDGTTGVPPRGPPRRKRRRWIFRRPIRQQLCPSKQPPRPISRRDHRADRRSSL